MNFQKNKLLIFGGGFFAILLLAEVVFLMLAVGGYNREKGELKRNYRQLEQLHNRNPFPSMENTKDVQENLDRFEYEVGELAAALVRDPFPQEAIEAADFSARAQGVIERFRKRAEQSGVVLPDTLEAGFAPYASGGAVPAAPHVPRLSRQLYSVERVADVLVRSGVDSIDSLTRNVFETETVPVQRAPRRRPRREAPPSNVRKPTPLVASEIHAKNLYYIERVGVAFTAGEDVVWRVLDLFAAAPHFMVVSEFTHTTQSGILAYNPEAVKRGGEGDDETLRYLSEGILVGKKALSRPERIISGNEIVKVALVVDVYNFEPREDGQ
ncbi:MAG: Amuc_1100 family pilus-like protein [Verrucomicrobiota bacterium]|nr:Amuc_1100 family pilus-like protein [Verrucomicrobiota bacterium]